MQNNNKSISLEIITWRQLQNGLYDYRTDKYDEKHYFESSKFKLPAPPINTHLYYIIHFPFSSDLKVVHQGIRLEKRKDLRSSWDGKANISQYKLMGAFKVSHKEVNGGVSAVFVQAISAQDIRIRERDEKKSFALAYWVVRTFPNDWLLRRKEIIKFGRLELFIDEIKISQNYLQNEVEPDLILDLDSKIEESQLQSSKVNNGEQKRCKICYVTESQEPYKILINPCKCKGSIEYIHLDCLKQWLENRLTKISFQSNGSIKITDKDCCQICKVRYPLKIKKDGKVIPLMQFLTQNPYISFRPVNFEAGDQQSNKFYLNFEEEKKIKIGRLDQENGLLLGDQTVSRHHAVLQIRNDQCYLMDQESKYGTLVYANDKQIKLGKKSLRAFQIQNSVFCFTAR